MSTQPTSGPLAIIVTGGKLGEWVFGEIGTDGFLIGADSGAIFLISHGYIPDLALGDFDSVTPEQFSAISESARETVSCDPVDKDWTDTELALREAISRGYRDIRILGGLGGRFDHSLANVHLLRHALAHGCDTYLIDEHNEIRLCTGTSKLETDDRYDYVSLLPLTTEVKGVTLTGFRYPLLNATLTLGSSLGISNVLEAPAGTVVITEGELLIIRSRD